MKAYFINRYGQSCVLTSGDLPEPALRDDDVLVQIHAAGVNPLDNKIRLDRDHRRIAGSQAGQPDDGGCLVHSAGGAHRVADPG